MFRRTWQSAMIALARSPRMTGFMQDSRATSFLSDQYVAGKTAAQAVERAQALQAEGIFASLFYMGEYVDRLDLVDQNVAGKLQVAQALAPTDLELHISIDPTQIGHHIDPALVAPHAERIATEIRDLAGDRPGLNGLMMDMEDSTLNDPTIALHDALRDRGLPTALTLQAYLKRTRADLERQIARGARVRLVKGAFIAPPEISFTSQADIKQSQRDLITLMLSPEARSAGFTPIIATHDTALHDLAIELARTNGWTPGQYEFEMLLGVRGDVARALAARGEKVRLYTPFGRDWWPYAVRRIGENPRNATLLARSLIS